MEKWKSLQSLAKSERKSVVLVSERIIFSYFVRNITRTKLVLIQYEIADIVRNSL